MKLTNRQHAEPTRTMVMLGPTEKSIIAQFARDMGISSHSAALRQIIRDWAKRNNNKQDEVKAA